MQLKKRNHYTPCFWAALWSETYYRSCLGGALETESVRDRPVHALNVKSGRLCGSTICGHSCATLLPAQGVSPRVVMETLGHSQVPLRLNTYSHALPAL